MNSEIEKLERRWHDNPLGLTFAPLAEAYRKSGDPARALGLLEVGLGQHPNYVPAHIVRGRCHLDMQATQEAESAFRRVVELDPENAIALKGLADVAEQEGRIAEAITRLEALLDVDRNNEEARAQLDRLREPPESREEPEAVTTLADTAELPPEVPEIDSVEFQFVEEAVSLSPDQAPMADLILHELGQALPSADAAQGTELVAAPDPSAARGTEPELEAEYQAELDRESGEAEYPAEPDRESGIGNRESEMESPDAAEPEPVPEPAAAAETAFDAVASLEAPVAPEEAEPAGEPLDTELVITETMAEIFLRQGHRELALAVYTQLAQRDPANARVAAACARLLAELAPAPATPAAAAPEPPAPETEVAAPPRYDAATTGGRSVGEWFAMLLAAERPTATAAGVHPPAFEPARPPTGEPTRAASEALSLSAIFGEETPPPAPAGALEEVSAGEPSFEQFFTPPAPEAEAPTAEIQLPKSPESESPAMSTMAPEDLEQFNAWLRGLKR